jgi:hypothetical protein
VQHKNNFKNRLISHASGEREEEEWKGGRQEMRRKRSREQGKI